MITDGHVHEFAPFPIILDALIETAKLLPFLFLAFWLMEYIEKKAGSKFISALSKTGKLTFAGPPLGGLLGILPQCGFSVAAANLFAGRLISVGTLVAVFLATSDEAIPILLANPSHIKDIWLLIVIKLIIAVIFGIIIDLLMRKFDKRAETADFEDFCHDCGCHEHGVLYSALKHTLNITVFILILNLIIGFIVGAVGEANFFAFLESFGVFQPAAAALVGLIPNCAASVLITELYIEGGLSFGSAVAGLCSGAGVGILVLFRTNKDIKENILIVGLLYVIGVVSGSLVNLIL
ncbi:MAG: arsenic efflux protein [Ruminococcus sp.]|jgi:hypothetical protein|nr:arsenic efflux protein [Ruminococcus sp.]